MVDYREILRLRSLGDSIRSIARSVCSGRDTVSEVLKAAEAAGMTDGFGAPHISFRRRLPYVWSSPYI